ncbi:uncharacterized protein LOC144927459 isoform X2 [Branchiostoma floridae x Branchiostoma belcheri]
MDAREREGKEKELQKAAKEGDTGRVKQLLAEGVNPDAGGGYRQGSSLHKAAYHGHHGTVSALLRAGADVNAWDNKQSKRTPLHKAAENGHHETVSVLLTAGADVDARNEWEYTALHLAAMQGHPKCAEILLQHGADTSIKNEKGRTAEDIAADEDTTGAFANNKDEEERIIHIRKEILRLLREQNNRVSKRKKGFDPVLVRYFEEGMTKAKKDCPSIQEAAKASGKTEEEVRTFIGNYRKSLDNKKRRQSTDDTAAGYSGFTGYHEDSGMSDEEETSQVQLADGSMVVRSEASQIQPKKGGKRKSKTRHIGESSDSGPLVKRPKQAVAQPGPITIAEATENSIKITWTEAAGAKDSYRISISNNGGVTAPSKSVNPEDPLDHTFTGLTAGTEYTIRVLTVSGGAWSVARTKTHRTTVAQPGPITIAEATENSIRITWTEAVGAKDSYDISISPDTGVTNPSASVNSGDPLEHTFTTLTAGTEYTISVVTVSGGECSVARIETQRTRIELGKLFFLFSQNVTQRVEVEALATVAGLTASERTSILGKDKTNPSYQANNVLLKWIEKDHEASMDKLQQELSDIGMDQLAQKAGRIKQQTKEKIRQAEQKPEPLVGAEEAMSTLANNLPQEPEKLRGQVGFPRASVPTEVEMGGPEMMALYDQACKDGTTDYYYIRLILTGKHGNGKSSLQNSLLQLEFNKDEESTDGIVITPCLMTGREQWTMTKGMKDHQFAHAVGTEMKKIQEKKEKKKKEPSAPKRTKRDKKTTPAPEVKPHQASSTDTDQVVHVDEPMGRRGEDSVEQSARRQETAEISLPEDYALASHVARDKDDFSSVVGTKEQPAMSIWDFAGHDVYYSSHHVFYSHYAIFILTLNLTKALSDPLEPWAGSCAEALQFKTEADVADYHLEAIQAHTRPNKSVGDQEENQGRGPPVIVVGTHKDQVNKKKIKDFFTKLRRHLRGRAIGKDVYDRYFAIDNTKRDPEDPKLSDLRDAILEVAQQQNHVGRRIPISWLELKTKLMEMGKQGTKYCSLQDVIAATDSSRVPEGYTPEENAVIILRFFHLCGDILFFNTLELRNFVVLDPQWFVDVQKTIITIPKFRDLEVKHKWEQLEATGVLEDGLIMDVWGKRQEELKCNLIAHKDELLKMMEQFDLVLQCSPESEDEATSGTSSSEPTYFVPSLLTTVKDRERLYPSCTKCSKPIFVVFDEKFFPVGVYHRLVIASMRRYKRKPLAYARCARFITRNPRQTLVITKKDHYLKVELISSEKEESACFSLGPDIRKCLDEDLREIIDKWIPGIRYKWCLQCCCANHNLKELDASSFIPITSVTEWFMDGEVVCETFAPATTTIQDIGLAQWFRSPHAGQSSRATRQETATTASVATDVLSVAEFFPAVVEMKLPWEDLGRKLGLSDDDIEQIRQRHQDDTSSSSHDAHCCLAVLEKWLHLSGTNASVDGLKKALVAAGQGSIVEKINTMERMMSQLLLDLQSQVTSIVRANFPNLDFVQAASRDADKERVQLNRKTLREELFSSSFNYSLSSFVYDVIQDRKQSVCRIDWAGGSLGTGFLLSKRKILTCYHVYKAMNAAYRRFTDLSWFTATFFVSPTEEYKVRFPYTTLKCSSDESGLDYAILSLAVDDEIASIIDSLPYLGRCISDAVDQRNMVVIVGHPFGGSKLVDFCSIAGLDQRHIVHVRLGNPEFPQEDPRRPTYHTGIMFHGSSGSPGFDTCGNLALMHTRGFFPDQSRQSIIERGVRLSAIRDDARQTLAPDVFNEIFGPDTSGERMF